MRYGKVYFYDRMGNREPTESDRVREALESFDAPRFRPPETMNMSLGKTYGRNFSPLETPPIFNQDAPEPLGLMESTSRHIISPDSDSLGFPPRVPMADVHPPFHDVDKFRMTDIDDDPKFRRLEPPRTLDPIGTGPIGEDIGLPLDRGIMVGAGDRLHEDMERLDIQRGLGPDTYKERVRFTEDDGINRFQQETYYEEHGELCAQCRLEEMHLGRMKAETDAEVRKHEEAAKKAAYYEAEVAKKEREAREEAEARRRNLVAHVDRVNEEILQDHRLKRVKSPPQDYYIFRREDENQGAIDKQRKEKYANDLAKQMEDRRQRLVDEYERREALDAASNSRAAKEFAAYREIEESRKIHDQDAWRRQLELQMQKKAQPVDDGWLWWAERPDEHGWRAARIEQQSNQVERNEYMKNNINRLEQFKMRQAEMDAEASHARRAKYAQIRDRLHENTELVFGPKKEEDRRMAAVSWQPNAQVEAAWREAHEKNDKKYRVLQESTAKSISGAAVGEMKTAIHCRRCVRCRRPIGTRVETRTEALHTGNLLWHAL